MLTILIAAIISSVVFAAGVLTGVHLTWWWMNREWKRNIYKFKTIIDEVIALREARDREDR